MRRESDFPVNRRRVTGRGVVITIGALFFLVAIFGRGLAGFYVNALWHSALGRGDVFWGRLSAQLTLFVLFFLVFALIAVVNLVVTDRTAPDEFPANVHPYVERFHEVFGQRLRLVRYGSALVLAVLFALPATSYWQDWLLLRNAQSFGIDDPLFGIDIGFYVFQLPFLSFVVDWLFGAFALIIILSFVAHLLNGGVLFTSTIPVVRRATKIHMAVLLALLALLRAGSYWLSRYELTSSRRGFVDGATYSVVNAQIPAIVLLTLVAVITAVLFLSTIQTDRWRLPLVASVLWLVLSILAGTVYPSLIESFVVRPDQERREAPFIARNVEATRQAYSLDEVKTTDVEFGRLTAAEIEADLEPLRNVRLLNPEAILERFSIDRGEVAGLQIEDLDVDRYEISGDTEQVIVTARELDLNNIPNTSWQGKHLVSTRGCGLVVAPVGKVTANDQPVYDLIDLERPELYFSSDISGYAITDTQVVESRCVDDTESYQGDSGVELGNIFKRAVFSLAFLDINMLVSGAIDSDSQLLWHRSVRERAQRLAPFLSYDRDPYPVAVDGRVIWVIDAFTTTSRYPYSQAVDEVQLSEDTGLGSSANYVRNSVKVAVDAYTGEITFYAIDEQDPILAAWRSAFPDLFTPLEAMSDTLRAHLRYPEDLFRVQTDLYSKYQLSPENFFQRNGAWSVSQAPPTDRQAKSATVTAGASTADLASPDAFASESNAERFVPYYTMFTNGITGDEEFVIFRPFVPFSRDDSRTELEAFMTASSDPDNYGELISYSITNDPKIDGPFRVADQSESEPAISEILSLQANEETGTRVIFGDMQVVPVADGLIYVRPVYVVSSNVPEYRFVIVSYNDDSVLEQSLDAALTRLFPDYDGEISERVNDDAEPADPDAVEDGAVDDDAGTGTNQAGDPDAAALLAQAEAVYEEAQQLLTDGDLGGYQAKMDEVGALIGQAADALDGQ